MSVTKYSKLKIKRNTSGNWKPDDFLDKGELGCEIDTHKIKVGDGKTPWGNLPYVGQIDGLDNFISDEKLKNILKDYVKTTDTPLSKICYTTEGNKDIIDIDSYLRVQNFDKLIDSEESSIQAELNNKANKSDLDNKVNNKDFSELDKKVVKTSSIDQDIYGNKLFRENVYMGNEKKDDNLLATHEYVRGVTTSGGIEVKDNLESDSTIAALSANMGRELNEKIKTKANKSDIDNAFTKNGDKDFTWNGDLKIDGTISDSSGNTLGGGFADSNYTNKSPEGIDYIGRYKIKDGDYNNNYDYITTKYNTSESTVYKTIGKFKMNNIIYTLYYEDYMIRSSGTYTRKFAIRYTTSSVRSSNDPKVILNNVFNVDQTPSNNTKFNIDTNNNQLVLEKSMSTSYSLQYGGDCKLVEITNDINNNNETAGLYTYLKMTRHYTGNGNYRYEDTYLLYFKLYVNNNKICAAPSVYINNTTNNNSEYGGYVGAKIDYTIYNGIKYLIILDNKGASHVSSYASSSDSKVYFYKYNINKSPDSLPAKPVIEYYNISGSYFSNTYYDKRPTSILDTFFMYDNKVSFCSYGKCIIYDFFNDDSGNPEIATASISDDIVKNIKVIAKSSRQMLYLLLKGDGSSTSAIYVNMDKNYIHTVNTPAIYYTGSYLPSVSASFIDGEISDNDYYTMNTFVSPRSYNVVNYILCVFKSWKDTLNNIRVQILAHIMQVGANTGIRSYFDTNIKKNIICINRGDNTEDRYELNIDERI